MIHEEKCYTGTCDNCGETYQNDHSGFSMYSTEEDMSEDMDNDSWYLHDQDPDHQDKQYCPDCFKWHPDIDDKIVLDESRKKELPTPAAALPVQGYSREDIWKAYMINPHAGGEFSGKVIKNNFETFIAELPAALPVQQSKIIFDFFIWFREYGDVYIDKSIEKMIDIYLTDTQPPSGK